MTPAYPDLSDEYPLSAEQIEGYRRDGHILLRQVVQPDELNAYYPAIREYTLSDNLDYVPEEEKKYYGVETAFPGVTNMWERNESIRRFIFARRFAKLAADLSGAEGIRLYHDASVFLPPGGTAIPWHRDTDYILPVEPDRTITMWMALRDIPAQIGSLCFVSGSQRLEDATIMKASRMGLPMTRYGAMKAGDATLHSGLTLHFAPANRTPDTVREVLLIVYIADKLRIAEPADTHAKEYRNYHLKRLFPGRKPGDWASSEFTPLLYSRNALHAE